jgi:Ca-activated chloride channel homolog
VSLRALACFAAAGILASLVVTQGVAGTAMDDTGASADSATSAQVQVPNRPSKSLFQGEQGRQRTEIHFDPGTGTVTVKLVVQDPQGYFIPNIRRENFAVYDNGIRQRNATVEIERAAVAVGLLIESGGRYQALNESLWEAASSAAKQFLDQIGQNDRVALWKYGDNVEQIVDFSQERQALQTALSSLRTPPVSELNFYDALIATLGRMQTQNGRKALILISSGVDTFSKATYEDALQAVRRSGVPIYAINLAVAARSAILSADGPYSRIDWKRAESELRQIATASGGRMYSPQFTFDLSGIFDDLMENLRVRYVITYKPTLDANVNRPRTVRIELVDAKTGGPLKIVDANGRPVHWKTLVEASYVPGAVPAS